jgi:hypothetical protein
MISTQEFEEIAALCDLESATYTASNTYSDRRGTYRVTGRLAEVKRLWCALGIDVARVSEGEHHLRQNGEYFGCILKGDGDWCYSYSCCN